MRNGLMDSGSLPFGRPAARALTAAVLTAAFLVVSCSHKPKPGGAAPNEPAKIRVKGRELRITYDGREIFSGRVQGPGDGNDFQIETDTFREGDKISQVVLITSGAGAPRLTGEVAGGSEAFPCEADRGVRGSAIVRHVSGPSRSLLNRAVYDRRADWVISVDEGPRAVMGPVREGREGRAFSLEAEGAEIVLRFRPRYYREHRGLRFFEPSSYSVWRGSVAGWTSWFAFLDKVTEEDIVRTADALAEVLLPFGYEYLQIDDGYQKGEGLPDLWLNTNAKFPRGLDFLARYIRGKGLRPGLWTNVAFKQAEFAGAHRDWFVTDPAGRPAEGNWIGFSLDASNPEALNAIVKPVFRGLREMGWDYCKVDALRHLRYEGYNAHSGYFAGRALGRTETFRRYVETIRDEIGPDVYLLGCWGIRPELIGLIDGCRVGTDGFSYAGLAQYNSWNNVVWRNDPDHIELDEDRYRSALVTSLTGSVLLLTDKPEVYRTEVVEPARRAAPVLWTVPGQLFDVDPSRSDALGRVGEEVSGGGPRVFDAGLSSACDLYLLEVSRPFEDWVALGRTGSSRPEIRFAELGLDPAKDYRVFEFWSKTFLGTFRFGFRPGGPDPVFRSQDFIIRERREGPQLLATGRHVSGGGVDLVDLRSDGDTLRGRGRLVGKDPYVIYIAVPDGFGLDAFESDGASVFSTRKEGELLTVTLLAAESREVSWSARFSRTGS